jgi:hypothetical protein
VQRDRDALRAAHHVRVGEDVTVRAHDEAGAAREGRPRLGVAVGVEVEEAAEGLRHAGVLARGHPRRHARLDADHRGRRRRRDVDERVAQVERGADHLVGKLAHRAQLRLRGEQPAPRRPERSGGDGRAQEERGAPASRRPRRVRDVVVGVLHGPICCGG